MDDFVAKPINPDALISCLKRWINGENETVAPPAHKALQARILIVNDDAQQLQSLAARLSQHYQVNVATNGRNALEIANRAPHPDLILLDTDMPELSGYDVCRQLDAATGTSSIPVLLMLADGIIGGQAMAEKIGVAGLIEASASHDDIVDRIKRTLSLISTGASR